jgi:pimeloyl-ACP methyl ester carboxylesterase
MSETRQPTVVLVHGAFADGSSWNGVIEPLQAKGVQVIAPANPLRGTSIDSEYTAALFDETPGAVDHFADGPFEVGFRALHASIVC